MKRQRLLFLFMIISAFFTATLCFAGLSGSLNEKQILLRIQPEGKVTVETDASATPMPTATIAVDIGQQRYEEVCHTCHATGLAGAPKFGDKAEWAPRLTAGMETLVKHVVQGYKAMPPKGSCIKCSEEDIRKAVEYMISHAK